MKVLRHVVLLCVCGWCLAAVVCVLCPQHARDQYGALDVLVDTVWMMLSPPPGGSLQRRSSFQKYQRYQSFTLQLRTGQGPSACRVLPFYLA